MSGIRVLVVDDSLLFREILSQELQKYLPAGSALETANDPLRPGIRSCPLRRM